MSEAEDAARVADALRRDYPLVRVLPDNSVAAVFPLLFTTSLLLGCDRTGWGRRFCFQDPALALQRFTELQSEDDVPEGFVASR